MSAGEVLAGLRYPLPQHLEVFALAGPGIGTMPGSPSFRAFAGVAFRPFPSERAKAEPQGPQECAPTPVCPPPAPVVTQAPPPDADRDGIPDAEDACPNQPGEAALRGCPPAPVPAPAPAPVVEPPVAEKPKLAELKEGRIEIKDQVRFATSKSEILADSFPLLEEVAKILKEHPELVRLEISGHTDNRGARDYNLKLSQDRAEAVRRFLIDRGVEPGRLEAKGYGPDQPIASNETAAGRQLNRRTVFFSVQ
jgi:outer membrane protein OmpA-like peptidoglycan-associated protein